MTAKIKIPLIEKAASYGDKTAIVDQQGHHSYEKLLKAARRTASVLLAGDDDLKERRVAFLVPSGFDYVMVQWGIWLAGGIAVPLCLSYPFPELEYVLANSEADLLVGHEQFRDSAQALARKFAVKSVFIRDLKADQEIHLPEVHSNRKAMILYTSGTTSRPKGVVTTHGIISAQIECLIDSWGWRDNDYILNVLPLHHVHGIINVLSCALWSGATCEMLPKFDAETVWHKFFNEPFTLFMAVPTIYVKLIAYWQEASARDQQRFSSACAKMRLMVSGSAALPVRVFESWRFITGHTLLERYGMTEIGMALSNPLHGERRPGYVGVPLPGVTVRLVDEKDNAITEERIPGEIQAQGKTIFVEYWNDPDATRQSFRNNWFCTGDTAVIEDGYFRILGRNSVDIIKSGGFKISALEIEDTLQEHPAISECSVVGISDLEWGERVSAAVVLQPDASLSLEALREWGEKRLAPYKVPSYLSIVESLPRNTMGKVMKQEVKRLLRASTS